MRLTAADKYSETMIQFNHDKFLNFLYIQEVSHERRTTAQRIMC